MLLAFLSPHPLALLPFAALLLSIALFPLIAPSWWNKFYPWVTLGLASMTALYYGLGLGQWAPLGHSLKEYFSFICLLSALFIIAGGIHLRVEGTATPLQNIALLTLGTLLANLIGTTGASMVLIRPFLRLNHGRWHPYHAVFFIFIVSNWGGALTPIGDPPLLLGYLRGIPFSWMLQQLWVKWALGNALLLILFYWVDRRNNSARDTGTSPLKIGRVEGAHNIFFLCLAVIALFLPLPPYLREIILISAALGSYGFTRREIHRLNHFLFHPLLEVAILFAGIFVTLVPAMEWMETHATTLPLHTAGQFYWGCGALSALLDNAPTYLTFLSAAAGLQGLSLQNPQAVWQLASEQGQWVSALSIGAVFFGAMTYIGNGPNLMVKSIIEHSHQSSPNFFSFTFRYACPILLPILILIWLLFFFH